MMSEASFASLGPTLLARKGGAKPAMRPQLTPLPDNLSEMAALADEQLEDLGWNDMGDADDAPVPLVATKPANAPTDGAEVVQFETGLVRPNPANEDTPAIEDPVVRKERKRLEDSVLTQAKSSKTKSARKSTGKPGRRAAFTLRLDADRHLKLRLAATMQGVSAQSLVTDALDAMLSEIDELDTLVERMQRD